MHMEFIAETSVGRIFDDEAKAKIGGEELAQWAFALEAYASHLEAKLAERKGEE